MDFDYLEEKRQEYIEEYLIQKAEMTEEDNNNNEYDIEVEDV